MHQVEDDFIDAWLAWYNADQDERARLARSIVSAAVDKPSDAESIREFLGHLTAAVRDMIDEDERHAAGILGQGGSL